MNQIDKFPWNTLGTWEWGLQGHSDETQGRTRGAGLRRVLSHFAESGSGVQVLEPGDGELVAPRQGNVPLLPRDRPCLTSAAGWEPPPVSHRWSLIRPSVTPEWPLLSPHVPSLAALRDSLSLARTWQRAGIQHILAFIGHSQVHTFQE